MPDSSLPAQDSSIHDPETAILHAPLGTVNRIEKDSLSLLKFFRRKNTKKDPLEEGKVFLSISLEQLEIIQQTASNLPDSHDAEEDLERIRGRYVGLKHLQQNLEDERSKRSGFRKIFTSSNAGTQAFLKATRLLAEDAQRTSDSITRANSIVRRMNRRLIETLDSAPSSQYEEVKIQDLSATDRIEGITIPLPENGEINDKFRKTVQAVTDYITDIDSGAKDDDAFCDTASTITPAKLRRNSFSSISTSHDNDIPTPPSPSPSTRSLPASPLPQHIHHHHYNNCFFGNNFTNIQESQMLGESLSPTFNTRSSGTQGATFSNPTSPA